MATEAHRPAVELVVLLASAGGLNALSIVLRDLPTDLPVAVVVHQHLGGHSSVLPTILGRTTPHRVSWARDGQAVMPGRVVVCPPETNLELMPDGCCRLREPEAPGERRFDVLLASVAGSYGARGLAVVLSGSGHDGARGTVAMKRAGAIVIAQSPDTAEYPSMPIAAAQAGADLVLPINEIGRVVADIIAGVPIPPPRRRVDAAATVRETGSAATPLLPSTELPAEEIRRTVNSAAARAEAARLRVAELRHRRLDLATGQRATVQTVATAQRRAEEALHRAQKAHQAAEEAAARRED
jgi:two-component system, chemotaxis family, protein-glutamate methylesterase/glutaminase